MIDLNSILKRHLVKTSSSYRRKNYRLYNKYNQNFKQYYFDELQLMNSYEKFYFNINNNMCLYKEIFKDKYVHVFKVKNIKGTQRFEKDYTSKNNKMMKFDFEIDVEHFIINENQEILKQENISNIYEHEKFICSKNNIFKHAEIYFNELIMS